MKVCGDNRCESRGQLLPLSDFSRSAYYAKWNPKDGLNRYCRKCTVRRTTEQRARTWAMFLKTKVRISEKSIGLAR